MSFWSGLSKVEVKSLVSHYRLADEGSKIREAERQGDQVEADRLYRLARTFEHAQKNPDGCGNPLCSPCCERLDILGGGES